MNTFTKLSATAVLLLLTHCSGDNNGIDKTYLEAHRRAIPGIESLGVNVPELATPQAGALVGDDALIPPITNGVATEINTHLVALLGALKTITDTPPTFYDSEEKEYLWGPFNNDDTELEDDTIAVYIRDKGDHIGLDDDDTRYDYALLRGMNRDLSTMQPVIWGGHTPDPDNEDYGQGVILYDLQANLSWEDQHNPGHGDLAEGRFAVAYAKQRHSTAHNEVNDADLTLVLGAFRDFIPNPEDWDNPEQKPDAVNAEYLWGGIQADSGQRFSFIDIDVNANVFPFDDPNSGAALEDFGILAAFSTTGVGRGQLDIHGDDVSNAYGADMYLQGQECWDTLLERTYFSAQNIDETTGDTGDLVVSEGDEADCPEGLNLDELPSLRKLEQEGADLLDALIDIAENGIPNG